MSLGNKLAKNITANYFGVAGQIIVAFFLSPFLVHTLGDTRYGVWTVVAALSGYMSLLDMGIASALTRYIARFHATGDQAAISRVLNSSLFLFLIISSVIVLLSPLIASSLVSFLEFDEQFKSVLYTLVIIVSFDVALFVTAGVFRGAFGGFQRFDIINIARLMSVLLKAVIFYLFLSKGYGLVAMGYISVAINVLAIGFYWLMLKRYYRFVQFGKHLVDKENIRRVISHSKFIFIAMVASQLLNYSSSFVIGYFISVAAITWFSIPWSLAEYIKRFCLALSQAYIPAFSQLEGEGDQDALYNHYLSGTKYILILSNLFTIGVMVMGGAFIELWMGTLYAEKAELLIYILFGALYFYSPHLVGYALMQGLSIHRWYAYMNVWIAVSSLILSILLVSPFGLEGIALGMAIPQIIFCGLVVPMYIAKKFKRNLWEYFRETHLMLLLPSLGLIAALILLKNYHFPDSYSALLLEALSAGLFYGVTVYWLGLNRQEKGQTRKLLAKLRKS